MLLSSLLFLAETGLAAAHVGSGSNCRGCHEVGRGAASAPKVVPKQPGWLGRLVGKKSSLGHPSVSCAGNVLTDGKISGCHRPENGGRGFLVYRMEGRPSDELCGRCHPAQRKLGAHHPSYKTDKNRDGMADTLVRPVRTQQIYTLYAPRLWPEPLRSYPDVLSFREKKGDRAKTREVVLPLQAVTEKVNGKPVQEEDVLTCTTCHNPHHGYLAGRDGEEKLNAKQVARGKGDALLRMRDFDNVLCLACH